MTLCLIFGDVCSDLEGGLFDSISGRGLLFVSVLLILPKWTTFYLARDFLLPSIVSILGELIILPNLLFFILINNFLIF